MEAAGQPLMFDDVAIYFTREEWRSLEEWQKELYKEVMAENYHTLRSLGVPVVKSELLLLIEGGEEPCVEGHPRWEEVGCEPQTAPDGQRRRDAQEVTSHVWRDRQRRRDAQEVTSHVWRDRQRRRDAQEVTSHVWRDRRALSYGRRVVRKRCGRRSPNFSRVELECFVSLMDRYLPDELQRTGAISLRQRRSILQDIARCLEPMSGCLRTPRQLLHRWADFNNRDPERLMEIRMQLHYAASGDQSWDVQTAPSLGRRWKRRPSRPLSSSSSEEEEGEETPGDPLGVVWDEGLRQSALHCFPVSDPPPLPTHIDAQGRYISPPPLLPGRRWWPRDEWMEEGSALHVSPAPVEESPGRATSATSYPSLQGDPAMEPDPQTPAGHTDPGPGLRTIKSEPDSEEDEGGGSWSSDIPSPESAGSVPSRRRKVREVESAEQPSPVSPLREPPAGDPPEARSIRRSPNFSPAELECFVALMDHFLPDNLIRAGAIPIRQRKAILQEIARRLQPLSGCLRTPRQLRHRWTDFNNRDPDRLEEIRRRLRRAARQESCKEPRKAVESTPAAGNRWRHRRSHPLQRDIKEEEPTPEQDASEEHTPSKPWRHLGLPKRRNSSKGRLKKNRHLALHILRMERLLHQVDQRQERQRADRGTDREDCEELSI